MSTSSEGDEFDGGYPGLRFIDAFMSGLGWALGFGVGLMLVGLVLMFVWRVFFWSL